MGEKKLIFLGIVEFLLPVGFHSWTERHALLLLTIPELVCSWKSDWLALLWQHLPLSFSITHWYFSLFFSLFYEEGVIYPALQIKLPRQSSFVPLVSWYPNVCVYSGWCSEFPLFLAKAAIRGRVNSWLLCPMCSSKIKSLLIFILSFTAWVLN